MVLRRFAAAPPRVLELIDRLKSLADLNVLIHTQRSGLVVDFVVEVKSMEALELIG